MVWQGEERRVFLGTNPDDEESESVKHYKINGLRTLKTEFATRLRPILNNSKRTSLKKRLDLESDRFFH